MSAGQPPVDTHYVGLHSVDQSPEKWRGWGGEVNLRGKILKLTQTHAKLSRVSFVREMPDTTREVFWSSDRVDLPYTMFDTRDRETVKHMLQTIMGFRGGFVEVWYSFDEAAFCVGPGEKD